MTDDTAAPRVPGGSGDPRRRSRVLLDGPHRAPARAMLEAVGLMDGDFQRPVIGVANARTEATPCKFHLRKLGNVERNACPGAGAGGGQFAANNRAVVFQAMGISPLGSASVPALAAERDELTRQAGAYAVALTRAETTDARTFMSRPAVENGIRSPLVMGGSTNAVLLLLAQELADVKETPGMNLEGHR